MLHLPYHGQRKPNSNGKRLNFLSGDLARSLEAMRQSIADIRALLAWFRSQGCPNLMLWGFSLGATLSGLITSLEPQIKCSVLVAPVTHFDRAVRELPFLAPIRMSLSSASDHLIHLNLVNHEPHLSPRNILIVQARYDLYVPTETVEQLWNAWKFPEMWRVEHGHISAVCSPRVMRRIVQWIVQRLERTSN